MRSAAAAFITLAMAAPLGAQQQVPFRNEIPVAPQGLAELPPPAAPVRYSLHQSILIS
jgi:hypothetical protein